MHSQKFLLTRKYKVQEGSDILKKYQFLSPLGSGNNQVFKVQETLNPQKKAALKIINGLKDKRIYESVKKEITILEKIKQTPHSNIIDFLDYGILAEEGEYSETRAYILMELGLTNLQKEIQKQKQEQQYFTERDVLQLLFQMISGLAFLQSIKISHCDIKPENILKMDSVQLRFKLCDVGSSSFGEEGTAIKNIAGTVSFLAPELLDVVVSKQAWVCKHNKFKADVFSLGLCILYFITFQNITEMERKSCSKEVYQEVLNELQNEAFKIYENNKLQNILKQMLVFNPQKRVDFTQLKQICFNEFNKPEKNSISLAFIDNVANKDYIPSSQSIFSDSSPVLDQKEQIIQTIKSNSFQSNLLLFRLKKKYFKIVKLIIVSIKINKMCNKLQQFFET